jgi:hypothetical protein
MLDRSDEGALLVDVLCALGVVSVVVLMLGSLTGTIDRHTRRIAHDAAAETELIAFDHTVRTIIGRVRTPYWYVGHAVTIDRTEHGDRVSVDYVDGIPGRSVLIDCRRDTTTIECGREVVEFHAILVETVELLYSDGGNIVGLRLQCTVVAQSITIDARFGSRVGSAA